MNKIEKWFEPFKNLERLSFSDAKKQYIAALKIEDVEERNRVIDTISMNTLYVIYEYVQKNNIEMFVSSSYDIDDIMSSLCEEWLLFIRKGILLEEINFSNVFYTTILHSVEKNFHVNDQSIQSMYALNKKFFIQGFNKYIELRNAKENVSFDEFLSSIKVNQEQMDSYDRSYLFSFFNKFKIIYDLLKDKNEMTLDLKPTKVSNYWYLLACMGSFEALRNNIVDDKNIEDRITQKYYLEEFKRILENYPLKKEYRDILYRRFGLNGNNREVLETIAKSYHVSKQVIRQKEALTLRKLRWDPEIRDLGRDL